MLPCTGWKCSSFIRLVSSVFHLVVVYPFCRFLSREKQRCRCPRKTGSDTIGIPVPDGRDTKAPICGNALGHFRREEGKMQLISRTFEELTARELYEILRARAQIFVVEQNRVCRDLDGIDDKSRHIFYEEDGKVTAYLRAFCREEGVVQMGRALTLTTERALGESFCRRVFRRSGKSSPVGKPISRRSAMPGGITGGRDSAPSPGPFWRMASPTSPWCLFPEERGKIVAPGRVVVHSCAQESRKTGL